MVWQKQMILRSYHVTLSVDWFEKIERLKRILIKIAPKCECGMIFVQSWFEQFFTSRLLFQSVMNIKIYMLISFTIYSKMYTNIF